MKNIVMMTCDDNPCGDNEVAAFRARKQASELFQHQIDFDVISFGEQFDSSKLFKVIISIFFRFFKLLFTQLIINL